MFNLHVFYSFCTSRVFVLYVYVRLTSNMSKCKVYSFIPRVPSNVHVSVLKIAFTRLKFPFHFKEFFVLVLRSTYDRYFQRHTRHESLMCHACLSIRFGELRKTRQLLYLKLRTRCIIANKL